MKSYRFLQVTSVPAALLLAGAAFSSCHRDKNEHPQLIILGFDGMDPRLCERLMNQGRLPRLAQLREAGGYRPLGTRDRKSVV